MTTDQVMVFQYDQVSQVNMVFGGNPQKKQILQKGTTRTPFCWGVHAALSFSSKHVGVQSLLTQF